MASKNVAWDFPVSQESEIDSFRIKRGDSSGNYNTLIGVADKTLRTFPVQGTSGQTYFVVVCSLSGGIESALSNEITIVPEIPAPTNLRVGTV